MTSVTGETRAPSLMIVGTGTFGGSALGSPRHSDSKFVLAVFRAIVGAAGMRDLCAAKGGTEIWVPRECDADHWMSRLFGEAKANAICERINVIDADGRVVGNTCAYVPIQNGRIDELKQQIEEEIKQGFLAGKEIRDIARECRVGERAVHRHKKLLRIAGVLPDSKIASSSREASSGEYREAHARKAAKVDELLIAGRTNNRVKAETHAGICFIRQRRKILAAAGKLKSAARSDHVHAPAFEDGFAGSMHLPNRAASRLVND